jgi:hypothetical protein
MTKYLDLQNYDDDFEPAKGQGLRAGPEQLEDGDYTFEIQYADFKTPKNHKIFEMQLKVTSAGKHEGAIIQASWFMNDKESVSRVGKVLQVVGFDTENWTKANGRPLSGELSKAIAFLQRKRLRVAGKKVTNEVGSGEQKKVYHNIYINERILTDGVPAVISPEVMDKRDDADPF